MRLIIFYISSAFFSFFRQNKQTYLAPFTSTAKCLYKSDTETVCRFYFDQSYQNFKKT